MTIIGILTIAVGVCTIFMNIENAVMFIFIGSLLGSAAAILIGSTNVQPVHLLLGFLLISLLLQRVKFIEAISAIKPFKPGFWLAWAVAYGVVGAYFLPRIFAGSGLIIPIGSTSYDDTGGAVPLGPTSGNLTQSIYLLADLACFTLVRSAASSKKGLLRFSSAMILFCTLNIGFAMLDVITYQTGTAWLLDFIRNAQYTLHTDESSNGLKRVVGSFLEASAFSHATLAAYGFSGTMYVCGRNAKSCGIISIISLFLLLLSTSSTGIIGSLIVTMLLYYTALRRCSWHGRGRYSALMVIAAPFLVFAFAMIITLVPQASNAIFDMWDSAVIEKSNSLSGLERSMWNATAWADFLNSDLLGVGLGTTRASTLILAFLSNIGLFGTAVYTIFLITSLSRANKFKDIYVDIQLAARNSAIAQLTADMISGTLVDQGMLFFSLAAVASACMVTREFEQSRDSAIVKHPAVDHPQDRPHKEQAL